MSTTASSTDSVGSITRFFDQLRAGDPGAAEELWLRFFPRLVALARQVIANRPQRVADADDAAQSAFASFCLRVKAGEFRIQDRTELWNLLGVITANKARKQMRREAAQKRGGHRILDEGALARADGSPIPLDEIAPALSLEEFDLHCQELLDQLGPVLREFALLRLLGYHNREIAARLDCTERTVERKLNLIRLKWETAWLADESE